MKTQNTIWHTATVTKQDREKLHRHKSFVLWFTGLSGSGKSTLAHAVEEHLHQRSVSTFVLDGDNVRKGLCHDLGFSDEDRVENIRRISEVAKLMIESGTVALVAFISPFNADRTQARNLIPEGDFLEIYCRCSLDVCEQRDVKGLYKKARAGEIPFFTGIDSIYEPPENPELIVDTDKNTLEESIDLIINCLNQKLNIVSQ